MTNTLPLIKAALLALAYAFFLPVSASAYQVGDQFKPPAVDVPFAVLTATLKTEFDYDQGTGVLKLNGEIDGKYNPIWPEAGMLIDFELLPSVFEGKVPDWFLPIPAGAFVEKNGDYNMSGTPKELGIQLLVVEDGVVVADLTNSIDYIKATLILAGVDNPPFIDNPTFVDNPTFILKLTATGYFEGHDPQWLPLGAAAGVQIFIPDANGLIHGGGAATLGQKVEYGGGISH